MQTSHGDQLLIRKNLINHLSTTTFFFYLNTRLAWLCGSKYNFYIGISILIISFIHQYSALICCVRVTCVHLAISSSWPKDYIWPQKSGSTLAQIMGCCLSAPSHCLNQCWIFNKGVLCHSTLLIKGEAAVKFWRHQERKQYLTVMLCMKLIIIFIIFAIADLLF